MHQLHILKAGDQSEVRIIYTVANDDWGRMAAALGFDESTRTNIFLQAPDVPEFACEEMFERWLKGGEGLRPATWRVLMKCLDDSGYEDIARKVNEFILH